MLNEMGINIVESEEARNRGRREGRGGRRRGDRRRSGRGHAEAARHRREERAVRAHRRSRAHVSARDGLGRAAVARGRDRHRQAHRGRPRGDDRGPVRKPAHLPGHHHLARRAQRRKSFPPRHHRPRSDLCRARRQEPDGGECARRPDGQAVRRRARRRRRLSCRRPRPQAAATRRDGIQRRRRGAAEGDVPAEGDMDDDEFENSMSLAAIEAELKPKVLETFDTIAERIQAAAPPAGPGHREAAEERDAHARAGAQIQEAQGRDHHRGEVAAAQPGPHRRAGRSALRHQ